MSAAKSTGAENECHKSNWSARQIQRRIGSLLHERTGLSTNKHAVIEHARRQAHDTAVSIADLIRDPYVIEFSGLPSGADRLESELENALLNHLPAVLLELGSGFCFEARQKRITVGNEHDYLDLVFDHRVLRCLVLIDLKARAFRHGDAGQMNFYLNYWRDRMMQPGDNPPVGLLLCADKDETKVQYATGGLPRELLVSRYLVALPNPADLQALVDRDYARWQQQHSDTPPSLHEIRSHLPPRRRQFRLLHPPRISCRRVSYPVITPLAARGIFEAILMKPIEKPEADKRHNKIGFRWVITRIGIVKKGPSFSILRNELGYAAHQSPEKAKGYEISSNRAQRHSLILRDVEYLIEAVIEVPLETPQRGSYTKRPSAEFLARNKYHQMFLHRARAGQCFYQPFLGCREFSAREWELVENPPAMLTKHESSEDFGMMFRDFDFDPVWNHWPSGTKELASSRPTAGWSEPAHRPRPRQIHAMAVNGWITIPAYGSNNGGAS